MVSHHQLFILRKRSELMEYFIGNIPRNTLILSSCCSLQGEYPSANHNPWTGVKAVRHERRRSNRIISVTVRNKSHSFIHATKKEHRSQMRAGLIRSEIRRTNQVKLEAQSILPGSRALSWKLIFCDKLIAKTDFHQPDSQAARARQSFSPSPFSPSLSSTEQRRRMTWQPIRAKGLEERIFQRRR